MLSQKAVAAQANVSAAYVSLVENNRLERVSATVARRLAEALAVSLEELVLETRKTTASTTLHITVRNRKCLAYEITKAIAAENLSIHHLVTTVDSTGAGLSIAVERPNAEQRRGLFERLKSIDDVQGLGEARDGMDPTHLRDGSRQRSALDQGVDRGIALLDENGNRIVTVPIRDDRPAMSILIVAEDRVGLIRDLARVVSLEAKLNINAITVTTFMGDGVSLASITFVIDQPPQPKLGALMDNLGAVEGVMHRAASTNVSESTPTGTWSRPA